MYGTNGSEQGQVVDGIARRVDFQPDRDVLAILEQRNKLLDRILEYAIRATHPSQWNDLGGKPWPTGPACESMARRCGVSISNVRRNKRMSSDDMGDFYVYEVDATAALPSGFDSIEAFGTCSSRDQFLGTETGAGRKLSEIDEGNIMKAAYTNMEVNAITRLLGVRNLSWERLAELGIGRDGMTKVTYDSGSKGGGQKASGSDLVMKFGKGKDKTIAEQTDENLGWYAEIIAKDLTNPDKAKFKTTAEKQLAAIKAEQARRAAAKDRPNGEPSPYEKCVAMATEYGLLGDDINTAIKSVLGRTKPSEVTADDVAKFSAHLKAKAAA